MLNKATADNIERKSAWADRLQLRDGVPLPSWIDINTGDACNRGAGSPRACPFCPRIDGSIFPNQKLFMSIPLARKVADELMGWDYGGAVVFSGFGEVLLHPEIVDLVAQFGRGRLHLELVSNGDRLTPHLIDALYTAGVSYIAVSCYDGLQQFGKFNAMFKQAGVLETSYGLRDRWHSEEDDWGLRLTNRAGLLEAGNQKPVDTTAKCFYPSYEIMLDWQGDVLLCCQDWHRRVRFGNVNAQSLWSIWTSSALHKRRMKLAKGQRTDAPCSGCNAAGTVHGSAHVEAWQ